MYSVDLNEIERMQSEGDWEEAAREMSGAAKRLKCGGADFIVLCTNTMHKLAPAIEAQTRIPLLHIADTTGKRIRARSLVLTRSGSGPDTARHK